MTTFRLEPYIHDRFDKFVLNHRIIYKKNEYNPIVKVTNWEEHRKALPIDTDPYCPGSQNYSLSHYKRLGWGPDEPFVTTTQAMLEQIHTKDDIKYNIPQRTYMVNYFGFNDLEPCIDNHDEKPLCEEDLPNDWITTMQDSYINPNPHPMKRLSVPTIPFLKYRRLREENPILCDSKFYDESFADHIEVLQKVKGDRYVSFNPWLGEYADGCEYADKPEQCVELEHDKREAPATCLCPEDINNNRTEKLPCLVYI